jgi:uncharacterized protein with FMN-binding domain
MRTHEQHSQAKLLATVVSVIVIAGVVIIADHIKSKSPSMTALSPTTSVTTTPSSGSTNNSSTGSSTTTTPSSSSPTSSGGFTDGTYSATSDYFVPSGNQSIKVNVTLKSGVITAASVSQSESDPTSAEFQQGFASQYKSYVVGQKIDGLQLSVIAGASDTSQGFANALSQIENKAKA